MLATQRHDFDDKNVGHYPQDFARWYQLDYFRRPRPLKRLRFWITFGVTLGAAVFSAASVWPRFHHVHQAAPVAQAHTGFNQNCATCHDQTWQPVWRLCGREAPSVSDASCKACHQGAVHHHKQAHEPSCASCHREHQGKQLLATLVANRHCTFCHGNLPDHLKPDTTTTFHKSITHFNRDHPEFGLSWPSKQDDAKLRFNHARHMGLELEKLAERNSALPTKYPQQKALDCANCHQVTNQPDSQADSRRRYMAPIKYQEHCATCHQLPVLLTGEFKDPAVAQAAVTFRKTSAPHTEPSAVRALLRERFVQFAQTHKTVPDQTPAANLRPLPWRPEHVSEAVWAKATGQTKANEDLLFTNEQMEAVKEFPLAHCARCHIQTQVPSPATDGLPVYAETKVPTRWYKHSIFSHDSHRMVDCKACHLNAWTSTKTADILLPTKQICQQCHQDQGLARNDCVECHQYHDPRHSRSPATRLTIEQFLNKR